MAQTQPLLNSLVLHSVPKNWAKNAQKQVFLKKRFKLTFFKGNLTFQWESSLELSFFKNELTFFQYFCKFKKRVFCSLFGTLFLQEAICKNSIPGTYYLTLLLLLHFCPVDEELWICQVFWVIFPSFFFVELITCRGFKNSPVASTDKNLFEHLVLLRPYGQLQIHIFLDFFQLIEMASIFSVLVF